MRRIIVMVLLAVGLEVVWLVGGMELLRGKLDKGPVGRVKQELSQVKTLIEKASEALKVDQASLERTLKEGLPGIPGDPARNPFALPEGIRLLAEAAMAVEEKGRGEPGASAEHPAKAAAPEPKARQLSGILVGGRDRVAIIDGTLARMGDTLDDERVVDIQRDHVVLARDGERRTLRLPPPFPESTQWAQQVEIRPANPELPQKRSNGGAEP